MRTCLAARGGELGSAAWGGRARAVLGLAALWSRGQSGWRAVAPRRCSAVNGDSVPAQGLRAGVVSLPGHRGHPGRDSCRKHRSSLQARGWRLRSALPPAATRAERKALQRLAHRIERLRVAPSIDARPSFGRRKGGSLFVSVLPRAFGSVLALVAGLAKRKRRARDKHPEQPVERAAPCRFRSRLR